jgi:hypothetical protein
MADEVFSKLMLSAVERYDRAVRLSWALIAVLAFFHVTTFERYVATLAAMESAKTVGAAGSAVQEKVGAARQVLDQALAEVKRGTAARAQQTVLLLRQDFALLDFDTARIWCAKQVDAANFDDCVTPARQRLEALNAFPSAVGNPFAPEDLQAGGGLQQQMPQMQQQMQQQMPQIQQQMPDDLPLPSDGEAERAAFNTALGAQPELVQEIGELSRLDRRLIELLGPYIQQEIIIPRIEALQDYWMQDAVPRLADAGAPAVAALGELAAVDPELADSARQTAGKIEALVETARNAQIAPPPGRWWQSVSGKKETLREIEEALTADQEAGEVGQGLSAVEAGLAAAIAETKTAETALQSALDKMKQEFETQKAELVKVIEPLKAIPLDLTLFCRYFPLLLLLAGLVALAWTGEKLRIAWLTAEMAREAGEDDRLWRWLQRRRGRTYGFSIALAGPYLLGLAMIVWSAYAADHLDKIAGLAPGVWNEFAGGAALLAVAFVWRWWSVDRELIYG